MSFEMEIEFENADDIRNAIDKFGNDLEFGLYDGFIRASSREENILKSTTGFQDRTGHARRSLVVTAVLHPLGIEISALAKYSYWLEFGHGTWVGGWFREYLREAIPRIMRDVSNILNKLVDKFNAGEA